MRLVEVRRLDGPNVYRLVPAVKLEVAVGRRRTWYGQRMPGRHAVVRLGAAVPAREAPPPVRDIAAWVRRLHALAGVAMREAAGAIPAATNARAAVTIHRSSEPGHWVVAWPWHEGERASAIGHAAYALAERGLDPVATWPAGSRARRRGTRSRTLAAALEAIAEAGRTPPAWIRDADRGVPTVSISGTNGKSTTTRMITRILRVAGRRVGTTTSDGVLVDERLEEAGDLTGPLGARRVLTHPEVTAAVLETARGGILLRGVGYESNDAAVLTNVSSDHMDLQGLHTLPELAEVKGTIARMTHSEGTVVLNAEDDLVAGVARTVRARVAYFAIDPARGRGGALVRRHLERGGLAMLLEDGWLVEREGPSRRPVVAVDEVPSTLLGLARHNVANALAAAAAARALGASIEDVAAGLRSFAPSPEDAPGRLNLYRLGDRLVIVDFAHNEAGLGVSLDVAEGLAGSRRERQGRAWVTAIVGTAGDRPDDTLRGLGRIAASRADQVAIKETLHYLRGRTRRSVVGELRAGMAEAGVTARDVPVHADEPTAVAAELTDPVRLAHGPLPGVLLLMCHEDRGAVVERLASLGARPADTRDVAELRDRMRGLDAVGAGATG
jgi:cyanophycin synthetase